MDKPISVNKEILTSFRGNVSEPSLGTSTEQSSGLDSRYMISRLRPLDFEVLSLTTVATPHRGSAFADYMLESIGRMFLAPGESIY